MDNILYILEYAEELGKIPIHSIKNLQLIIDILNDNGYTCYISSDTDYLIVEVI